MKAGVLALQGAFREHAEVLDALDVDVVEVRRPEHLAAVDALFLPGGESTTIGRLLTTSDLLDPLRSRLAAGLPTFGTCAGLILLAREVYGGRPDQPLLAALDVAVARNAYGTQLESFEAPLAIAELGTEPFPGVFIRAPVVARAGPAVVVAAEHEGHPVFIRQGNVWASTFHPELSGDLRLHRRFLGEVS
jgi:5'-phosphate synthase pdxT subunit